MAALPTSATGQEPPQNLSSKDSPSQSSEAADIHPLPPSGTGTNGLGYTVSSLYIHKRDLPPFVQLDHLARRRQRDVEEIVAVGGHQGCGTVATHHFFLNLNNLLNLSKQKLSANCLIQPSVQLSVQLSLSRLFRATFPRMPLPSCRT